MEGIQLSKISIIIPIYNVEVYLHRCVDSILAQTFTDFELILVDDGSPDNCGAICDDYAQKDSRVHVIHQKNSGPAAARNAGIDWAFENTSSEWLAFVDSDDWVHPEYLEYLYRAVMEYDTRISMCPFMEKEEYCIEQDYTDYASRRITAGEAYTLNTKAIAGYVWGKLYHRSCFSSIRFPVGRLWEDLAITYKLLWNEGSIALVERTLYYYFENHGSIVRSDWSPKRLDELWAYEEQIPFFYKRNEEVFRRLVKFYILRIVGHRKGVKASSLSAREKRGIDRLLRRKLYKAAKLFRKEAGITVEEEPWVYEQAFPKMMELYWLSRICMRKLGIGR